MADRTDLLIERNRALLAAAEETRAQASFVQCHSLIVQIGWLLSATTNPPWRFSPRASYARYERIADAAWTRGVSRWLWQSRQFAATHKMGPPDLPLRPFGGLPQKGLTRGAAVGYPGPAGRWLIGRTC